MSTPTQTRFPPTGCQPCWIMRDEDVKLKLLKLPEGGTVLKCPKCGKEFANVVR